MRKTSLTGVLTMALALIAGPAAHGQSAYFQAVTNLNPIGYWPLNETTQPPAAFSGFSLTASNSGSLGAPGNGFYGAWYQPSSNTWFLTNNIFQTNGISGPSDKALWCKVNGQNNGQYVVVPRAANGQAVTNLTLVPPFSIEAWVLPNNTAATGPFGIVAEGGSTVNYGGPNTNNSFYGGGGTGYAGVVVAQYSTFFLFDCFATNGTSKANELDTASTGTGSPQIGKWNHLVCTFDGINEVMWLNGVQVKSKAVPKNNAGVYFAPDLTTPFLIGTGPDLTSGSGEGGINMNGCLDEVAVYNAILPQASISNHFAAANTTGYSSTVLLDNPILYYQFNELQSVTNGGYPLTTYPVATNYGSLGTNANGAYQPGTSPGAVTLPYTGFGSSKAVALNGFLGAVDVGGGAIPSALNPVGKVPFTVVSWFQGNLADAPARYQDIVGHGGNSYRLALGTTCGENRFNPGGPELQFFNPTDMITNHASDNDGKWHMAAGVTDGTNAYMYLDGVLVKSTNSVTGISIPGSTVDLLLGGDPGLTYASYNGAGTDRTFDGQIAQVACWNSALSTAQIQSMFNAAGVPPSIVSEPVGITNNQGASISVPLGITGSQPISCQWYYTNGATVSGQTNQSLTYASVPASATGSYYVIATSPYGSVTSTVANVLIYGAPEIQTQSQPNLEIYTGSDPILNVSAVGAPPIMYQWYSNNVLIAGATNNTYTVPGAENSGVYTCVLTNYASTTAVTSAPISVSVLPLPTAPYPSTVIADHPEAFWRLDKSSGTAAFDYLGGNNGTYTNTVLDFTPPYDPTTDPSEGYAPGFGISANINSYVGWVPTNINFAAPTNVNGEFSVECWLQQYLVFNQAGVVSLGYGNGGEEFCLDTGGGSATSYYLRFYVRNAGGVSSGASSTFAPSTDGAWHHVVGVCDEANSLVTLYIDGTNAGHASIPIKSGVLTSTQSIAIGSRQATSAPDYTNQFIGAIDEVAVYNYALTAAQVQNHYLSTGIGPKIGQLSPSSQTADVGGSATFTATVTGTSPITYQWTDPNNNVVSTNLTLNITNVQQSAQGTYTFSANNPYGSASGTVFLSVNLGPPSLVQDIGPATQTVQLYSGLDVLTYSIAVSGTEPFSYQWYENGSQISGATGSSYTFTAQPGTNTYYVTVTNAATASQNGGVPLTSQTATVIGLQAPQLNPANYAYRVKIGFPGYTGHPLTNFPALVTLSPSTVAGLNYNQFQPNGADLHFTDASGTAELPYEIDEWNDSGLSTIWVQIPILNGTNIWAYWGNSAGTNNSPASSNVWTEAGYQIVYHMKESAFPFADSTGSYPGTNGIAPFATNGVVGHAGSFNGSDYITPGAVTLSNQFTTYAWVYLNTSDAQIETIWANQVGGYGANGFSWFIDSYNTGDRITHFDSGNGAGAGADPTTSTVTPAGQWHFVTAVWDQVAGRGTNYLDGVANGTGTVVTSFALTNQLDLGAFLNPSLQFNGEIDEARIQYGIANTNWITTTYLNMNNSAFMSYSSVNLEPLLSITTETNGYLLSWSTNNGTFKLESTTNVTNPSSWAPVTNSAPVITNGVSEQFVPPTAGNHFYRLQGQ
jgi:hypothetical protein